MFQVNCTFSNIALGFQIPDLFFLCIGLVTTLVPGDETQGNIPCGSTLVGESEAFELHGALRPEEDSMYLEVSLLPPCFPLPQSQMGWNLYCNGNEEYTCPTPKLWSGEESDYCYCSCIQKSSKAEGTKIHGHNSNQLPHAPASLHFPILFSSLK